MCHYLKPYCSQPEWRKISEENSCHRNFPMCIGTLDAVNGLSLSLSLLVVRRFDDDAPQRVSLCRRMWLLSPKAEEQTRPHTVQADPCRVVVGCGWLRCWCLCARFATATSICCCSKVASPLSQTPRHSSRSPANSSSLSKGIPHLLKDDLMWSSKRFFWPPPNVGRRRVHYQVGGGASLSHGQATSVAFWVVSSRGMLCLLCGESQHEAFCPNSARAG